MRRISNRYMIRSIIVPALILSVLVAHASERLIISSERIRLGEPDAPEWEWFENDPARSGPLEKRFQGQAYAKEATLFIRQSDVKLEWRVHLNGKHIGKLFLMEDDLIHAMPLAPG